MEKGLVTVVMPTYKREWRYVFRALESLEKQSYKKTEIIVIDDSPEDYLLRESIKQNMFDYAQKNKNVRFLINEKNMGGSLARNKGIDYSNGEYITFLDDDDEYLPDKIKNQVEYMEETQCDLSFEDMKMYNEKGNVVDYRTHRDINALDNKELLKYHLKYHMTGTPTFMFRASALKKIGGFDDANMGQEFYLMFKAIKNNLDIRYIHICDVKIYKHSGEGISQGKNKITGENNIYRFKKKHWNQLSFRDRVFIRFRHHMVMAVAYARNRNYFMVVLSLFVGFCMSPIDFINQGFKYVFKIKKGEI